MKQVRFLPLALVLAACGSSPPTQFYTLAPVAPEGAAANHPATPVTIGNLDLPSTLSREQIVRSVGPNQLEESSLARWAAPLDDMARAVLLEDLERILPPGATHTSDEAANDPAIDVVNVQVERFESDAAGHVGLDADWTITTGNPIRTVQRGTARLETTASNPGYPAMAAAMSQAVADLAQRIAATLPDTNGPKE